MQDTISEPAFYKLITITEKILQVHFCISRILGFVNKILRIVKLEKNILKRGEP